MKRRFPWRSPWLLLLLAVLGLTGTGCSTTSDRENRSDRPWNQPRGWETGLPSTIYDRRY